MHGNENAVRSLLQAGSSPFSQSNDACTARDIAHEFRHLQTELLLLKLPSAPHGLEFSNIKHSSFCVEWQMDFDKNDYPDYVANPRETEADSSHSKGLVQIYMVEWNCLGDTKVFSKITTEKLLNITSLEPVTMYEVTVKAANEAGWGKKSIVFTVQTASKFF
jgi:hypothetical protein